MPITVVTGIAGSGKTSRVIELIESFRASGRPTLLMMCSDSRQVRSDPALYIHKRLSSRNGSQTFIDHVMSADDTRLLLTALTSISPYNLVFEEAQYYGDSFADLWILLSSAGHNVVVSTPSANQLQKLEKVGAQHIQLHSTCNLMADGPATRVFLLPTTMQTISVCYSCAATLQERARKVLYDDLIASQPHPGEKIVYQPIDLPFAEFHLLEPLRRDSHARFEIMRRFVSDYLPAGSHRQPTYLDVGCNTGFFCRQMASIGFSTCGVDVMSSDIRIARLLDTYFVQHYVEYIEEDAVSFLMRDRRSYDVASTFSVFQWIFTQGDSYEAKSALKKLMSSTKSLFFFEMGYTNELHYKDVLSEWIDRDWMYHFLRAEGQFANVHLFEEGCNNLKRDFFVAVR